MTRTQAGLYSYVRRCVIVCKRMQDLGIVYEKNMGISSGPGLISV